MSFTDSWKATGKSEAGYADNPADTGGPTNFGITEAVARAHGYSGDMKNLPQQLATRIAKAQYWDTLRLDDIAILSSLIASKLFDIGFLMGIGVAGKFLQTALNIFNRQGNAYGDMTVDSVIGPMTVATLHTYLTNRPLDGETVLLRALNVQEGARMIALCLARKQDEEFAFGWFLNRVS